MKNISLLPFLAICLVCGCGPTNKIASEDDFSGHEAVSTGYTTVKRSELTGSASVVDIEKERETTSLDSIYDYLRTKVSGVEVKGDGSMGGTPSITVRGVRSLNGPNEALLIVNGTEVPDLNFLSPADVKTVTVLKDASMTVEYGSRGANGVIVITTKR